MTGLRDGHRARHRASLQHGLLHGLLDGLGGLRSGSRVLVASAFIAGIAAITAIVTVGGRAWSPNHGQGLVIGKFFVTHVVILCGGASAPGVVAGAKRLQFGLHGFGPQFGRLLTQYVFLYLAAGRKRKARYHGNILWNLEPGYLAPAEGAHVFRLYLDAGTGDDEGRHLFAILEAARPGRPAWTKGILPPRGGTRFHRHG